MTINFNEALAKGIQYSRIKTVVPQKLENSTIQIGKKIYEFKDITVKDIKLITSQASPVENSGKMSIIGNDGASVELAQERSYLKKSIRTPENYFETIYTEPYITETRITPNERFSVKYKNGKVDFLFEKNYKNNSSCCIEELDNGNIETSLNMNNSIYVIVHNKEGKLISLSEYTQDKGNITVK